MIKERLPWPESASVSIRSRGFVLKGRQDTTYSENSLVRGSKSVSLIMVRLLSSKALQRRTPVCGKGGEWQSRVVYEEEGSKRDWRESRRASVRRGKTGASGATGRRASDVEKRNETMRERRGKGREPRY